MYKCNVVNELGECVANVHLQIQNNKPTFAKADQISPSILEKPRVVVDDAKKSVRIEIRMKSKPEAQISWFKEKLSLTNGKKYKIETRKEADNSYLYILEILVS